MLEGVGLLQCESRYYEGVGEKVDVAHLSPAHQHSLHKNMVDHYGSNIRLHDHVIMCDHIM